MPLAAGPVIGGALAGSMGWRAIFWFLAIYSGVFLIALLLLLPESLRSLIANGSLKSSNVLARYPLNIYQRTTTIHWEHDADPAQLPARKTIDILGPFHILISKYATPIIIFLAIYYAVWQMSITAMSSLFKNRYNLSEIQIGLTFIANGVGSMIGTLITGKLLDLDYNRVKTKYENQLSTANTDGNNILSQSTTAQENNFPLEKARLRLIPIFSCLQCLSIILFGWTIQFPHRVHIAVPIVSTFITGWAAVSTQTVITTYLVDLFPDRSAAATASLNLARCLFAAGGTGFVMPMIDGIGVGVTFTICAAVQGLALVGPLLQWRFAAGWRREAKRKEAREDEKV